MSSRPLGLRWGRSQGENLRAEPGFLKLPTGEEEEGLSPVPCPSVSPRWPADSAEIKIAGGLQPWNGPYGNSLQHCEHRGCWAAWMKFLPGVCSLFGGWTSALPAPLQPELVLFRWLSQDLGCCFCPSAEQHDDKSASNQIQIRLAERVLLIFIPLARFENRGPAITATGISEERACALMKA